MKRIAVSALVWVSAVMAGGCGKDELKPVPVGRSGARLVAGSVRARSDHYKLVGTLGSSGGGHASRSARLRDGSFVNGQR